MAHTHHRSQYNPALMKRGAVPTPWHRFRRWQYGYNVTCLHRSPVLRLPCLRTLTYDGYCARHNRGDEGA